MKFSYVHSHSRPEEGKTPVEGNKPQHDNLLERTRTMVCSIHRSSNAKAGTFTAVPSERPSPWLAGDTENSEASK